MSYGFFFLWLSTFGVEFNLTTLTANMFSILIFSLNSLFFILFFTLLFIINYILYKTNRLFFIYRLLIFTLFLYFDKYWNLHFYYEYLFKNLNLINVELEFGLLFENLINVDYGNFGVYFNNLTNLINNIGILFENLINVDYRNLFNENYLMDGYSGYVVNYFDKSNIDFSINLSEANGHTNSIVNSGSITQSVSPVSTSQSVSALSTNQSGAALSNNSGVSVSVGTPGYASRVYLPSYVPCWYRDFLPDDWVWHHNFDIERWERSKNTFTNSRISGMSSIFRN
uniref:hypothetical protein n=1 Tax=Leucopaxillus giganteus TaxID=1167592 RepID=UPI00315D9E8C